MPFFLKKNKENCGIQKSGQQKNNFYQGPKNRPVGIRKICGIRKYSQKFDIRCLRILLQIFANRHSTFTNSTFFPQKSTFFVKILCGYLRIMSNFCELCRIFANNVESLRINYSTFANFADLTLLFDIRYSTNANSRYSHGFVKFYYSQNVDFSAPGLTTWLL